MTAAAFQSTVSLQQGFGVIGEVFTDSFWRAESFILDSASAAYNIFGRGFTIVSQGIAQAGNSGGSSIFAGILINPKTQALIGDGTNTLNPSLTLPNFTQADLLTTGSIIVSLPAACNIGDSVIFDNTTGALSTIAPGVALPSGKTFANAVVDYYTLTAASLAVITLSPALVIPVAA